MSCKRNAKEHIVYFLLHLTVAYVLQTKRQRTHCILFTPFSSGVCLANETPKDTLYTCHFFFLSFFLSFNKKLLFLELVHEFYFMGCEVEWDGYKWRWTGQSWQCPSCHMSGGNGRRRWTSLTALGFDCNKPLANKYIQISNNKFKFIKIQVQLKLWGDYLFCGWACL